MLPCRERSERFQFTLRCAMSSGNVEILGNHPPLEPRPLEPRHDLRNHSPDGFEWGYSGSGPAQLALALAADVLGDDDRAVAV